LGQKCVTYQGSEKRKMGPIIPAALTELVLMPYNGTSSINMGKL
jgi:hypothetical protein